MLKALVIKELRESAGIIAMALLALLYLLATNTGVRLLPFLGYIAGSNGLPFISDGFLYSFAIVMGAFATALGLKQSAWEAGHGTYYFLLHRPTARSVVFGTKLALGAALVLALGGLVVLLYGMWLSTPGNNPAPFFWSMTMPAWQLLLGMSAVYVGAFLSGIRPARWFGTRLLPLVAAALCALAISWIPWFWLALAAVALGAGLMVISIFFYAQWRDY